MQDIQNMPDPDVNDYDPSYDPGAERGTPETPGDSSDIEVPVPPDSERRSPVEEPPGDGKSPIGDVDNSPEILADGT